MYSAHTRSLLLVLLAGVLWSTVGLGIRLIEDADVWQSYSIDLLVSQYFYIL